MARREIVSRREALGILGMKIGATGIVLGGGTAAVGVGESVVASFQINGRISEFLGKVTEAELNTASKSATAIDEKLKSGEILTDAEVAAKPALDRLTEIKARKEQVARQKENEINTQEVVFGQTRAGLRRLTITGGGYTFLASAVAAILGFTAWVGPVEDKEYLS
jgi:hypothetical protein